LEHSKAEEPSGLAAASARQIMLSCIIVAMIGFNELPVGWQTKIGWWFPLS
jgi:hypothetical protein